MRANGLQNYTNLFNYARKLREKWHFLLFFAYYFVPLQPKITY